MCKIYEKLEEEEHDDERPFVFHETWRHSANGFKVVM